MTPLKAAQPIVDSLFQTGSAAVASAAKLFKDIEEIRADADRNAYALQARAINEG
jgi:hypothetical protein